MINFEHSTGFDLETYGDIAEYMLQPYRATTGQAGIKAAAAHFSEHNFNWGELYPSKKRLAAIIDPAITAGQYIIGWNVAFDAAWLIAVGLEELVFKAKWLDAMLLWRHAVVEPEGEDVPKNKRKSYSLESAMKEFYPEHADFKEFDDFEATDEASLKLLLERVKGDAVWPVRLAEKFWDMLTPRQRTAALIEARCIPMMAKNKVMGLYASKEGAEELEKVLTKEAVDLYRELLASAPEIKGINIGSTPQLRKLIYDDWSMPVERYTKPSEKHPSGQPSTDKFALFDLAKLDPRCALLKKIREAKNNRKKYAVGTLTSLEYNGDGYVRPQPKIFSTYTSRITYGSSDRCSRKYIKTFKKKPPEERVKKVEVPVGIALHQWKRGKEYRRLIMPPPGYLLVEFDFAGQEYRWMAVASGDETMLSLCAPGEDPHGYMGAQIAQRDYKELVILNKAGDSEAANDRKCGKFCIAEGELVLTDQGLVPIEKVTTEMKLWDGVEWVNHEGVIFQGEKGVITYDGLTATPDHKVFTHEEGETRFDEALINKLEIIKTGLKSTCINAPTKVIPKEYTPNFVGLYHGVHPHKKVRVFDIANAGPRHRFTVSNRLVANCNLSYQYRVSAKTATTKARVEFGLEVDETFISQTQMIYRESYPGVGGPPGRRIGGYWASQIQKCKHLGYAETFAGRRVQLKDNWAGKFKWSMESTAINYPIQGTGGDQKYLALAVARNILPKYDGYFYYELHDGLFFIFPEDKALAACDELELALSNLPYKAAWGVDLPIQFPVDGQIGKSWGELEDLNKYRERMGR